MRFKENFIKFENTKLGQSDFLDIGHFTPKLTSIKFFKCKY